MINRTIFPHLLALLGSLPFSAAYFLAFGSYEVPPSWLADIRIAYPALFEFAQRARVYQVYGRIFFLVIPLTILALLALERLVGITTRLPRWGWYLFLRGVLPDRGGSQGDHRHLAPGTYPQRTAAGVCPLLAGGWRLPVGRSKVAMRSFILYLTFLLVSCTQMPTPVPISPAFPQPVIFDGDMAQEDMFAALFLLQHPNVDLKAITVVGTGEAHCTPGVENLRGIAALAGQPEVPVACGRETPLAGDHVFPDAWRQDADNVYGVALPAVLGLASEMPAPALIAQIVKASQTPVTIVATGPLTNIAELVQDHPDAIPGIAMIYVMGGAVDVPGNVGVSGVGIDNDVAEWNIYIDPAAANIVLGSGVPVTLIPLDATNHVPVTRSFYKKLDAWQETPAAQFMLDVLTAELAFVDSGGFQFWDSFTAAVAVDETLAKIEPREIRVEEAEGPESGWTRPTPGGFPVRVAVWGDLERYEALLLTVLNRKSK